MIKIKYLPSLIIILLSSCVPPSKPMPALPPPTQDILPIGETQSISGVPTIEPTLETLQLAIYPPEIRTGDPVLDPIIDALLNHDFSTLKELTSYTRIGCTYVDGMGGPPKCQEGEAESTILEVVPFLGPEGHHTRKADYVTWEGPDVLGLLAAYQTSAGTYRDPSFPAGEFAILFLLSGGPETITLQVTDGKIIRYDYNFGGQTAEDLDQKAEVIILPLVFNPTPTIMPWNDFSAPTDQFSFIYPQSLHLQTADKENSWHLGSRIRVEVLPYDQSWITCFYKSLGDCPFVELDQNIEINGQESRRIEGYIGAVGGYTPQEFLTYIFNLNDQALVMTVYALPFGTQVNDPIQIWPLEGMELELFERIVQTVILN